MHRYRTIDATENGWRTQIEADLETGVRPVFDLGLSHAPHRGLHSLIALYDLANTRIDVTAPIFVAGGSDARWLAAMFYADSFIHPPLSPLLQILFAGADMGTYLATFAAFSHRHATAPTPTIEMGQSSDTYNAMIAGAANHILVSGAQTGDIVDWASLPIAEMARESGLAGREQSSLEDSASNWLAWSVLLFAVALLLLAVIV